MREGIASRRIAPVGRDLRLGPEQAVSIGDSDVDVGVAVAMSIAGTPAATNEVGDFLDAALRACKLLAERDTGEAS